MNKIGFASCFDCEHGLGCAQSLRAEQRSVVWTGQRLFCGWEVGKHCHKFFVDWNSWNAALPFILVLGCSSLSFVIPGISSIAVEGKSLILVYNCELLQITRTG